MVVWKVLLSGPEVLDILLVRVKLTRMVSVLVPLPMRVNFRLEILVSVLFRLFDSLLVVRVKLPLFVA